MNHLGPNINQSLGATLLNFGDSNAQNTASQSSGASDQAQATIREHGMGEGPARRPLPRSLHYYGSDSSRSRSRGYSGDDRIGRG